MVLFVSNILKILSAATIPIWSELNLSAICLNGQQHLRHLNKEKLHLTKFFHLIILNPHTINPIVTDEAISATGKKLN